MRLDASSAYGQLATVIHVAAPGCVMAQSHWQHWPCLFPQHGPGRKHERPIVLDDWQREIVEDHPGPFLRGLFHSDGCRAKNWTDSDGGWADEALRLPALAVRQRLHRHP